MTEQKRTTSEDGVGFTEEIGRMLADASLRNAELEEQLARMAEENERLRARVHIDEKTGLHNFSYFTDYIAPEIEHYIDAPSERRHDSLWFMTLDIDDMKGINRAYSHAVGDNIINLVGNSVKETLRQKDWLGRNSDAADEFLGLVRISESDVIEQTQRELVEKIVARCKRGVAEATNGLATISVGFVEVTEMDSLEQLLTESSRRMFEDKAKRRPETPPLIS